jgi:predicted metalloenzyme YecM
MSQRFLRWAERWIEENIPPGANPDIETYEAKAKRLLDKLFSEAALANFKTSEVKEEQERIQPLILAAVSDSTDFDVNAYHLKSQLAQENEDGD